MVFVWALGEAQLSAWISSVRLGTVWGQCQGSHTAPKMEVSPAMFQAPVQTSCSTPPVPNQAHQQVNLSARHPNQISPEGAQLEDNSQSQTQITGDKDEASEAVLPGASLKPAASCPSWLCPRLAGKRAAAAPPSSCQGETHTWVCSVKCFDVTQPSHTCTFYKAHILLKQQFWNQDIRGDNGYFLTLPKLKKPNYVSMEGHLWLSISPYFFPWGDKNWYDL